jgi:hypothetical protein
MSPDTGKLMPNLVILNPRIAAKNNSASLPSRFSSLQHADVMPDVIQKLGSLLIGLLQTGFSEESMKEKMESVFEDASAYAQFINSTGETSRALYLATHPEEKD